MLVGPIVRTFRGLHETFTLPTKIEELQRTLQTPIENEFNGLIRFEKANQLNDTVLIYRLQHNPEQKNEIICNWKASAEREYHMAEIDLKNETATKAEVARLAIAVKSYGLNLKEELDEIKRQAQVAVDQAREEYENKFKLAQDLNNETINRRFCEISTFLAFWLKITIGVLVLLFIGMLGVVYYLIIYTKVY